MKLVFLLEEESMKRALEGVLPRLLPEGVSFHLVPHQGISDLESSIPRKLKGWREPGVRFIVVRDQERHPDCKAIKARLAELCRVAGRPDTVVRIVCRALEAWFLADLLAVETGLGVQDLAKHQHRAECRDPDEVVAPVEALKRLAPRYQKLSGARAIGPHLDLANTRSPSFRVFVEGVRKIAARQTA
jgi:hypothetical protein